MGTGVLPALMRRAILVAALLLAQASAATHVDLDDTHPAGDVCEFCVGLSTLGAALPGSVPAFDAIVEPQDAGSTATVVSFTQCVERCSARGPPKAS